MNKPHLNTFCERREQLRLQKVVSRKKLKARRRQPQKIENDLHYGPNAQDSLPDWPEGELKSKMAQKLVDLIKEAENSHDRTTNSWTICKSIVVRCKKRSTDCFELWCNLSTSTVNLSSRNCTKITIFSPRKRWGESPGAYQVWTIEWIPSDTKIYRNYRLRSTFLWFFYI